MIDLFARQRPAFSPSKATKTPPRKAFAIEWKAATPTNRCARLGAPFGKTAACAVPKLALARLRFSLVVEVRHLKQKELLYEIVRKFWPQNCGLGCDGRIGRCLSWCRSGYEKFDRFRAAFGLPPGGGSPSIDGWYVSGYEPGYCHQYHGLEKYVTGRRYFLLWFLLVFWWILLIRFDPNLVKNEVYSILVAYMEHFQQHF